MLTPPQTHARRPQTLAERLASRVAGIQGRVYARAGTHPYRLFRVVRGWSGGEVGRGVLVESQRVELRTGLAGGRPVPPSIVLSGQYARSLAGVVEDGMVVVEDLDGTYLEGDLVDYGRLAAGDESFYELVEDGRAGGPPDRPARRFTLEGTPVHVDGLTWSLRLREQQPSAPFGNAQLGQDGGVP